MILSRVRCPLTNEPADAVAFDRGDKARVYGSLVTFDITRAAYRQLLNASAPERLTLLAMARAAHPGQILMISRDGPRIQKMTSLGDQPAPRWFKSLPRSGEKAA